MRYYTGRGDNDFIDRPRLPAASSPASSSPESPPGSALKVTSRPAAVAPTRRPRRAPRRSSARASDGRPSNTCSRVRPGPAVRNTPNWPRSWADFSLFESYSCRNAWANLRLLGQPNTFLTRGHGRGRAWLRAAAHGRCKIFSRHPTQRTQPNARGAAQCCVARGGAPEGRRRGRRRRRQGRPPRRPARRQGEIHRVGPKFAS
jgi:hypothetical protein